ncbi:MAG: tRNA glutamyl-Q(34) synthetase GluQRS [Rubripirellula sp.]
MTGRFAPSPTGAQHLGNARTYLLAYWSARSRGENLVLRIEDVDSPRVKSWAVQQAIDDLSWLGIDWDEGPDVGGPNGPYVQTERRELYRTALSRLIESNRVFPCTCTRKDIAEAGSAPHFDHEPAIYPGTCSEWQDGDVLPESGSFSWRFRVGHDPIEFDDVVLGAQRCVPTEALGAFPITQKNGEPSYQLAVVIDDAGMGVTEVVRGNDLVASTYRQIELYQALGLAIPRFAHVPLVLGADGRRLAKRHGDTRISQYREQGLQPEQIVCWAARTAGMIDPANKDRVSAKELVSQFRWNKLRPDDVVFESEQELV